MRNPRAEREYDRIADAVADRGELLPEQAGAWVAGLDPAFSSDPFGLALVGRDRADPFRLTVGLAGAWKPMRRRAGSFEERRAVEDAVLAEVVDVCLRYRAAVLTDQFAAPAVVDYLRRRELPVRSVAMSAARKTAAFDELRARLYSGTLELYDEPQLIAELRRLRARHVAGQASVVNPRSSAILTPTVLGSAPVRRSNATRGLLSSLSRGTILIPGPGPSLAERSDEKAFQAALWSERMALFERKFDD